MNNKCRLLLPIWMVLLPPCAVRGTEPVTPTFEASHVSPAAPLSPVALAPLPGIARPVRDVTLSAPLEGLLAEVHVREGQRVAAGDVLAVIDNRVARAAVKVAEAAAERSGELQQAQEEVRFSQLHLERQLQLKEATGASGFELLEAETRHAKAKAALLAAEQEQRRARELLELERARLDAHNIRAPFGGEIVRLYAQPGKTLTRDDQLLTLVCVDALQVELYVPLTHYRQLQVGTEYPLVAGDPVNRTVMGRLDFVAPVIDSATRAFRTLFTLHNQSQELPAGFSVQLDTQHSSHPERPSLP